MFNHSTELDQLAPALIAFQSEMTSIAKNAANDEYGSAYLDLAGIWAAIREPLYKAGLCVVQLPASGSGHRIGLETILLHETGQFISLDANFPLDSGSNIHDAAAAITYLRRYAIQGALGLVSHDDDGNGAAGLGRGKKPASRKPVELPDSAEATTDGDKTDAGDHSGENTSENAGGANDQRPVGQTPDEEELEFMVQERLLPVLKQRPWARYYIPQGKNAGKLLGELDDDSLQGYVKVCEDPANAGKNWPALRAALEDWKAYRAELEQLKKDKAAANPVSDADKKAAKQSKAGKPEPLGTEAQQQAQADLKKKNLPKRPAQTPEPAKGTDTAPKQEKASGAAARPQGKDDWRSFIMPIGKTPEEKADGSKGLPLGELPLAKLKKCKESYLDKRPWNEPSELESFDLALKAAVEAGIANDGREPEPEPLPDGPVKDLYDRLESFIIQPVDFLGKMKIVKMEDQSPWIDSATEKFADMEPETASYILSEWDAAMQAYESDIPF